MSRSFRLRAEDRRLLVGLSFVAAIAALAVVERSVARAAAAQAKGTVMAPHFEVDPLWPKKLPNHWVLGQVIGLTIDPQDHVWIVHRDNLIGVNEAAASENPPALRSLPRTPSESSMAKTGWA